MDRPSWAKASVRKVSQAAATLGATLAMLMEDVIVMGRTARSPAGPVRPGELTMLTTQGRETPKERGCTEVYGGIVNKGISFRERQPHYSSELDTRSPSAEMGVVMDDPTNDTFSVIGQLPRDVPDGVKQARAATLRPRTEGTDIIAHQNAPTVMLAAPSLTSNYSDKRMDEYVHIHTPTRAAAIVSRLYIYYL